MFDRRARTDSAPGSTFRSGSALNYSSPTPLPLTRILRRRRFARRRRLRYVGVRQARAAGAYAPLLRQALLSKAAGKIVAPALRLVGRDSGIFARKDRPALDRSVRRAAAVAGGATVGRHAGIVR